MRFRIFFTILLWMGAETAAARPNQPGMSTPPASRTPGGPMEDGSTPPMTDIHDIKPLLDMGHDWWWLSYAVAAIALALLALARWLWNRRKSSETSLPVTPPIAADVEALGALDALAAQAGVAPKQFYYRLSAILRRYVERRFQFPAAEMTTEELLPKVDQLPLDLSLTQALKEFCKEADPIKFAGAAAKPDRLNENLGFVRDFVKQTTVQEQDDNDQETEDVTKRSEEDSVANG